MSGEPQEPFEQQAIFIESIEPRKIVLTYTVEEGAMHETVTDDGIDGRPCNVCGNPARTVFYARLRETAHVPSYRCFEHAHERTSREAWRDGYEQGLRDATATLEERR